MSVSYVGINSTTSGFTSTGANVTLPTGSQNGDQLFVTYVYYGNASSGNTVAASSNAGSMTVQVPEYNYGGSSRRFFGVFSCVLNATDISNGTISVAASDSYSYSGKFILTSFRGVTASLLNDTSVAASSGSSPSFTNTITPLSDSQVLLMIAFTDGNFTGSAYAITTTNPTWTEIIDESKNDGSGNYVSYHIAYSSTRDVVSATGNSSMSLSGSSTTAAAVIISMANSVDVTVTGSTGLMTFVGNSGDVTGSAAVTGSTGVITLVGNAGTFSSPTPDWTNVDKSSTGTWTNQDKS